MFNIIAVSGSATIIVIRVNMVIGSTNCEFYKIYQGDNFKFINLFVLF